ncbi:patatin-like phospholipase family protein [Deinococcus sp. JMULE3]|uniref:patatin-like phospholipase family protein n=1 Tax=Deinococcus sp. JMULE3 TaxID=2518341 RepID=UPI00157582A7|nr:patatin-like phospholipase family protein [Deinococcus sp. JMULE3]NTX99978.1 patatin [Deinococcus sp. JMULE3]
MNYGLVLGGGGARGLAHIGVWRVLEEHGLTPGVLAGTSMGGLVGAFIAAGYSADEMERLSRGVSWRRLLDLRPGPGLVRSGVVSAWLADHLPATFEELRVPLAVTATDLRSGRAVYLQRGNLHDALRATSAYPGAVEPVALDGMLLSDGGILNQVPVDAARFLGARRVLAVDVTAPDVLDRTERRGGLWRRESAGAPLGTVQTLRRAVEIMQAQLTDARVGLYRPDVLLRPTLRDVDLLNFNRADVAVQAGVEAAQTQLPRLLTLRD